MKRKDIIALASVAACLLLAAATVHAQTKHVNCDAGESISDALNSAGGRSGQMDIYVRGDCNENVVIRRSLVWIYGESQTVIHGQVSLFSANGIRLNDLEITGPGRGLVVTGGADVITNNVTLSHNQGANLFLQRSATVFFQNGAIVGDCEDVYDEDCADGVVMSASMLQMNNSTISHSRYGVIADNGSTIRLGFQGETRIVDNSVVGVQAALHSNVELTGDVGFYGNRYHSLYLLEGSAARISAPEVHVDGNIGCQDWLSFLANPGGGYFGSTSCFVF